MITQRNMWCDTKISMNKKKNMLTKTLLDQSQNTGFDKNIIKSNLLKVVTILSEKRITWFLGNSLNVGNTIFINYLLLFTIWMSYPSSTYVWLPTKGLKWSDQMYQDNSCIWLGTLITSTNSLHITYISAWLRIENSNQF